MPNLPKFLVFVSSNLCHGFVCEMTEAQLDECKDFIDVDNLDGVHSILEATKVQPGQKVNATMSEAIVCWMDGAADIETQANGFEDGKVPKQDKRHT